MESRGINYSRRTELSSGCGSDEESGPVYSDGLVSSYRYYAWSNDTLSRQAPPSFHSGLIDREKFGASTGYKIISFETPTFDGSTTTGHDKERNSTTTPIDPSSPLGCSLLPAKTGRALMIVVARLALSSL